MKTILEIINLESSAENFIGDQLSYFQKNGHFAVHLICSPDERLINFAKEQGVKYKAIQLKRQIDLFQDIKSFIQICKYIYNNKIDIIICHQAKARTLAIPASWFMRVKHRIIFAHGVLHETMHGLKRRLILLNDQILGRMATNVICVSKHVMNIRREDNIDSPEKQIIIGSGSCNGIDIVNKFNPALVNSAFLNKLKKKYNIDDNIFVLGFCGRLVKDKGVIELAESFDMIKRRHPEKKFKLLIIGEPEKRDAVPSKVLEMLFDSPDVIYTGQLKHSDMPTFYMLMNLLIFPSHRDGLGLAPLEAEAMEVPALVTNITGCRETIQDGVTGHYIDLNPKSICDSIEFYFNEEKRKQFGKNGRNFICKNFSHEEYKKNILSFINSLN